MSASSETVVLLTTGVQLLWKGEGEKKKQAEPNLRLAGATDGGSPRWCYPGQRDNHTHTRAHTTAPTVAAINGRILGGFDLESLI